MPSAYWQKSSYSAEAANCLYLAAPSPETINLRESDAPDTIITTTPRALGALILHAREGRITDPAES